MIMRNTRRNVARSAFTLMEVLIVAAIILMLAGVSAWGYTRYLENAKEKQAKIDITHISEAVEAYKIDAGDYPESLQVLTQPAEGKPAYLEAKDLLDPWNQPYVYEPQNRSPTTFRPRVYSTHMVSGGQQISNW